MYRLYSNFTGCAVTLAIFLNLSFSSALYGQTNLKIKGVVRDGENFTPLEGVNITVKGTGYGTTTDMDGKFFLYYIPPGTYDLKISMIGYRELILRDIEVKEEAALYKEIILFPQPIKFKPLIVESSIEKFLSISVPSPIQVITKEMIAEMGANRIEEVFKNVPGIQIRSTGHVSGDRSISIWGSSSEQTLIMLNGVRLNSAQNNLADLSSILPENIERIEIYKGSQSALFGANAAGGAINIVTGSMSESSFKENLRISTGYGNFHTYKVLFNLQKRFYKSMNILSIRDLKSSGDFPYHDAQGTRKIRENAWINSSSLFAESNIPLSNDVFLHVTGQYYRARRGIPGALKQLTPDAWTLDERIFLNSKLRKGIKPSLTWKISTFYHRYYQYYFSPRPQVLVPIKARYINSLSGAEVEGQFTIEDNLKMKQGLSYQIDRVDGKDFIRAEGGLGKIKRNTISIYSISSLSRIYILKDYLDNTRLSFAARLDKSGNFPVNFSPKAGIFLGKGSKKRLTTRINWGLSYTPPSFNGLFWVEDVFARGNPELRPEHSSTFDAGVELHFPLNADGSIKLGWTYFESKIKDIIVWQRGYDGKYMPQNVPRAEIYGKEITFTSTLPGRIMEVNFSYNDTKAINRSGRRTTDGKILVFRPRYTALLALRIGLRGINLNLNNRWISRRYIREANTKFLKRFSTTDMGISIKRDISFFSIYLKLKINNVFNSNYQLVERHPMPGREYILSMDVERR